MKRTIYNLIGILVILCGLWSCQEEAGLQQQAAGENEMLLKLTTRAPEATTDVNAEYNEDKILSAYVFFFEQADGNCIYAQTGVSADGDNTLRVKLDPDIIAEGREYHIYVIANRGGNFAEVTSEYRGTIANLKSQTITTAWQDGDTPEASLLMDGEADITVSRTTPGEITLTRAMAKVSLNVTAADEIEVDGKKYTPVRDRMTVALIYDVQRTNLAGDYKVTGNDYISRVNRNYADDDTDGNYTHVPFYSYPNPADTENRKDSYLLLCVPWNNTDGGQEALNYYYRVPITGDDDPALMLRNHFYKINVNVSVLGGLSPNDAVDLIPDFVILDWFTMDIDAAMQNYQYLVLDEYNSVMNNTDELRMPYVSSSEIDWEKTKITQVTYWDYHNNNSYEVTLNADYPTDNRNPNSTVKFTDFKITQGEGNSLLFTHPLTNEDFVQYTITIDVWNIQGVQTAPWTITQYPAIYIVGENNTDGRNNRFVNGNYRGYNNRRTSIGGVTNLGGGSNENPNQYTIYITSFDIGDTQVIGDPRDENSYDFSYRNGVYLDVDNYKATKTSDVDRVIVPAYKVASSWGVTQPLEYEYAVQRCASYQENGYAAGRWRIPTKAEVEFIVNLSENKKIPLLFGGGSSNTDYWVSSGKYNTSNGYSEGRNGEAYVRCVYDVWYWSNKKLTNPNQFTWGDE